MTEKFNAAIQQPYFLPSFHYFQLINLVDTFVVFDDCAMKKKSFITRNQFFSNVEVKFSLNIQKLSQNRLLNEHFLTKEQSVFSKLRGFLRNESFFAEAERIIDEIESVHLAQVGLNLSRFNCYSLKVVCAFLKIETEFELASCIPYNRVSRSEEKLIEICKFKGVSQYVNLPTGESLYSRENWHNAGIDLKFINTNLGEDFMKNSIIFLIARFGREKLIAFLGEACLNE